MTGENLRLRAFRRAWWCLLALEQPIELERKGLESLPDSCYKSVTENEPPQVEQENANYEGITKRKKVSSTEQI